MFRYPNFHPYTIEDIKNHTAGYVADRRELRERYNIAFVDDKINYDLVQALIQRGFKLQHFRDLTAMQNLQNYDILMCDHSGVGRYLNRDEEGVYIVRMARLLFPWKYIISYTANDIDQIAVEQLQTYSDRFILKRNTGNQVWEAELDSAIDTLRDPYRDWNRIRKFLVKANVPTKEISSLEHYFVKFIKDQNPKLLNKVLLRLFSLSLGHSATEILVSLARVLFTRNYDD